MNLHGNAEAEQYLFVKAGPHRIVSEFYWVQFEHFLPTNNRTYDYDPNAQRKLCPKIQRSRFGKEGSNWIKNHPVLHEHFSSTRAKDLLCERSERMCAPQTPNL